MKKAIVLIMSIALSFSLLAGCGGAPPAAPAKTTIAIEVQNLTSYTLEDLYISLSSASDMGDDLLNANSTMREGQSFEFDIPASESNKYDITAIDEAGDTYFFTLVPLLDGNRVLISFGDDGPLIEVFDSKDTWIVNVVGTLQSAPVQEAQTGNDAVGTGHDTNGEFSFTVYNESDYDIYSIHMGVATAYAEDDIDILPTILSAGENTQVSGVAAESDWSNTEWTLFITDVDGDTSISFDTFNPWALSYVDISWDSEQGGYVCTFVY